MHFKRKKAQTVHFEEHETEPSDAEFYQEFRKYNESSRWITLMFLMTCFAKFILEMDFSVLEVGSKSEGSCVHVGLPDWHDNETKAIFYPSLRMACIIYDYNVSMFKGKNFTEAKTMVSKMKRPSLVQCSVPLSENRFSWNREFIGTCKGMFYRSRIVEMTIVGTSLGALILGVVADLYGRRTSLCAAMILYYLGLSIQPMVEDFVGVQILTVIKGIGKGGFDHVLVLFVELCNKNNRAILMLYITIFVPFAPLIVINMKKRLSYSSELRQILSLPALYFLFYIWFIPESPRWYLSFSRKRDAWKVLNRLGTPIRDFRFLPNIKFNKLEVFKENVIYLFTIWKFVKIMIFGTGLSTFLRTVEYSKKQFHTVGFLDPASHQVLLCLARLFSFMYALPPLIILRRRLALMWFFSLIAVQLGINIFCNSTARYVVNILMVLCIHSVRYIFVLYMYEIFPTCVRATGSGIVRCLSYALYLPHFLYEQDIYHASPLLQDFLLFAGAIAAVIAIIWLPETKVEELPDYKRYRHFYKEQEN